MDKLSKQRQLYGYDVYEPSYDHHRYLNKQIYPVNIGAHTDVTTCEQILNRAKSVVLDYMNHCDYKTDKGSILLGFGSAKDADEFSKSFESEGVNFELLTTRDQVNSFIKPAK